MRRIEAESTKRPERCSWSRNIRPSRRGGGDVHTQTDSAPSTNGAPAAARGKTGDITDAPIIVVCHFNHNIKLNYCQDKSVNDHNNKSWKFLGTFKPTLRRKHFSSTTSKTY